MKIKTFRGSLLTLSVFIIMVLASSKVFAQYQTARLFDGNNPDIKGYLEYLPDDYTTNPNQKYPVLIFLHGLGELGNGTTQISSVAVNGPPKIIAAGQWPSSFPVNGVNYKFIVISPQSSIQWQPDDINYVIDQIISIYGSRVDLSRIYLTGLSLGGGGVEDYLAQNTTNGNRIAAAVTCAGSSWWANQTRINNILSTNVPIWFFHNEFDNVVTYIQSVNWYEHLTSSGMSPMPKLTIYPGVYAHDSWSATYDINPTNPNKIYEWMLGFTRPKGLLAPISNAGIPQVINMPSTVSLDGTASTAPSGSIVSYQWTHVNGNWGDVIQSPNSAKTLVTFRNPGDYIYQLTVTDNNGGVNSSYVHVYVNNPGAQVPISNGGTTVPGSVQYGASLNSSGSSAPSGFIQSRLWTKISGPDGDVIINPSQVVTTINFLVPGNYTYALIITDGQGNFSMSTVKVIVQGSGSNPPISVPGSSQTLTLPNQAQLDGSASTDPSGTISNYVWSKVSGPSGDQILSPNSAKTNISFSNSGIYVYQLTVSDAGTGLSNSANITLTVNSNLPPPVSVPGINQTISLPSNATVDGSKSSDPSGTISSYAWTKISGPAGDQIFSPGTAVTNIGFTNAGTYVYQLTVTDKGDGLSNSANITITVNPSSPPALPPIAKAGSNQTLILPAQASLDGSGSTDPSGTISTYLWTKVSGPNGDNILSPGNAKTNISFIAPGTYVYQLTVTDNGDGLSNSASITLQVNSAPSAPVSVPGPNQTIVLPSNASVDGSNSTDPSGTLSSYTWSKVSGPAGDQIFSPNTAKTNIGFANPGTYVYKLTVADNSDGLNNSATLSITVISALSPPVSVAGNNQTITLPLNAIVDGSKSTDPSGTISNYSWSKISGPVGDQIFSPNSVKTNIGFTNPGTYIYQLTVKDTGDGLSNSSSLTITVNPSILPPIANAGSNQTILLPAQGILDGTQSTAPSGTLISFNWTKISGSAGDSILNPNSSKTGLIFKLPGSYIYQLVVKDNNGNTASSLVTLTVQPPLAPPPFANAGSNQTLTIPQLGVLDGTLSTSPGKIIQYTWKKLSGALGDSIFSSSQVKTNVKFTQPGNYIYELTILDNLGNTNSAIITIAVKVQNPVHYPPYANGGAYSWITLPTNISNLNASASKDSLGKIVTYKWAKGMGPAGDSILHPDSVITNVVFKQAGTYFYTITVTNNFGLSSSAGVYIVVYPAPIINPTITILGSQTIYLPNTEYLDGSGSKAHSGNIQSFLWTQISGPSGVNIQSPLASKTSITFLSPGVYGFQLTVVDSYGNKSSQAYGVTVNPKPKTRIFALAGPNLTLALPKNLAYLDGSASVDSGGNIIHYQWTKLSGPVGDHILNDTLVKTSVSFLNFGSYIYKLSIIDNLGQTADTTLNIQVLDSVSKIKPIPQIVFGITPTIQSSTDTIILDASASHSTGGPLVKTVWKILSSPNTLNTGHLDSLKLTLSNFTPGTYVFQLSVTDSLGDTASKTLSLVVKPFTVQNNFISNLKFYPNPVQDQSTLSYKDNFSGTVILSVYTMTGQTVLLTRMSKNSLDFSTPVDLHKLNSGIYMLEIQSGNHRASVKLLKQ